MNNKKGHQLNKVKKKRGLHKIREHNNRIREHNRKNNKGKRNQQIQQNLLNQMHSRKKEKRMSR